MHQGTKRALIKAAIWLASVAICAVLALFGTSPWTVPALLRAKAPQWIDAHVGRHASIGAVTFNPLHLQLQVSDLRVEDAQGRSDTLRVGAITLRLAWSTLWHGVPDIALLRLQAPRLRLVRLSDGRLDIADVVARLRSGPKSSAAPPRMRLDALSVRDGRIELDDRAAHARTALDLDTLSVDGLSTLPDAAPARAFLQARLDGAPLRVRLQGTPMRAAGTLRGRLTLQRLALQPLAGYQPIGLPVRLRNGSLSVALQLSGSLAAPAIGGSVRIDDARVDDRAGTALGGWRSAALVLQRVLPAAHRATLGALQIDGLRVHLRRGALPTAGAAPGSAASGSAKAPGGRAGKQSAAPTWAVTWAGAALQDGSLHWSDPGVGVDWRWQVSRATLGSLQWPLRQPVAFAASISGPQAARLQLHGDADLAQARLDVALTHLDPRLAGPYLPSLRALLPQGLLDVRNAQLRWQARPSRLQLQVAQATLDAPRIGPHGALRAARVVLRGAHVDLIAHRASVAQLVLQRPQASVSRDAAGRWSVAGLAIHHTTSGGRKSTASGSPWQLRLRDAQVVDGGAYLADTEPATPVVLAMDRMQLTLRDVAWPSSSMASMHFSARVRDRMPPAQPAAAPAPQPGGRPPLPLGNAPAPQPTSIAPQAGSVRFDGRFGLSPLRLRGTLAAQRLPLQSAAAYLPHEVAVRVLRALGSAQGQLALRGSAVRFDGDAALDDVSVNAARQPLLGWRSVRLQRMRLRMAPRAPTSLSIGQIALQHFYARVVLSADAQLNLTQAWHAPPARRAAPARAAPAGAALRLHIGGVALRDGRIDYTDYFVRPNYATSLLGVQGTVGAFGTGSSALAPVRLRATAQGDAPVRIDGAVAPLRQPPRLDLVGSLREFQLAPLSPYAERYAGYAIARGQLAMHVHYRIDPGGQLSADNHLSLDQLTLGAHVDSPDATHLPVALALALLKDPQGRIELDIPVSGSLHDPEFNFAALAARVVRNLFERALTAPFTLLAHLGAAAAGQHLDRIAFVPGIARLPDSSGALLDRVAQALRDRPDLILTITGTASPTERDALRDAVLAHRMLLHWRRHQPRDEQAAQAIPPTQRDAALASLYRATALPDKPRNLLGLPKSVPVATMRALLLRQIPADDAQLRALAMQRAVALRAALQARGVPGARQFIGAPLLRAEAPQAMLSLSLP